MDLNKIIARARSMLLSPRLEWPLLAAEPEVAELTLTMPNRHNIPMDFSKFQAPFQTDNPNMIFVATDEPHGQIECEVGR